MKKIPVDKRLGVTRHLAPHVSNRPYVYPFPTWGRKGKPGPQYLLVRLRDLKKRSKSFRQDIRDGFYKVLAKRGDVFVLKVTNWKKLNRKKDAREKRSKREKAKRLKALKSSKAKLEPTRRATGTRTMPKSEKAEEKNGHHASSKHRQAKSSRLKKAGKSVRARKSKRSKRRRRPRVR